MDGCVTSFGVGDDDECFHRELILSGGGVGEFELGEL
jgi:hypothetical protein